MSERAPVTYVVNKTGLSKRTVQAMARMSAQNKRAGNETAISPSPDRKTIGASYG